MGFLDHVIAASRAVVAPPKREVATRGAVVEEVAEVVREAPRVERIAEDAPYRAPAHVSSAAPALTMVPAPIARRALAVDADPPATKPRAPASMPAPVPASAPVPAPAPALVPAPSARATRIEVLTAPAAPPPRIEATRANHVLAGAREMPAPRAPGAAPLRSIAPAATDARPAPTLAPPRAPAPVAPAPASPIASSSPAAAIPRVAPAPRAVVAPAAPSPSAPELVVDHLDIHVIHEPPPPLPARQAPTARAASPLGAWRSSARRFLGRL